MNTKKNELLINYITEAIKNGSSETQIKRNLEAVGWSAEDIRPAYGQALINNGIPSPDMTSLETPSPKVIKKKVSPVEISANLISFFLLGVTALATGILFYQIINNLFPDALKAYSFSTDALHYAMAVTVISFPAYYFSMYLWFRGFRRNNNKKESGLSKFLTYLVLVLATITILGNLIATVYTYLQGELSIRFFLKALTIFILAGLIFGFYYLERKKIQYHKAISRQLFKLFGMVALGIITVGIVLGFVIGGSPSQERLRNFDEQRANDLSELSNCITNYAEQYHQLPQSLEELQKTNNYNYCSNKRDPKTKKPYSYRIVIPSKKSGIITEGEFELCAVFDLASDNKSLQTGKNANYYRLGNNNSKWAKHSAGKSCDKVTAILDNPSKQKQLPPIPGDKN